LSRSRKSEPEAIGILLQRVLEDLGAGEGARVLRIAERWEEALGSEIACHCEPTALRGDVLEVTADSSVWCQQLQLLGPELLASLKAVIPEDAPTQLWFRVGR
jgi:predicted nucleic acid-binding Zn ribbon protein